MSTIRVLLVEDHRMVREGIRALLEQASDLEVVAEAEDGQEAIRLAEKLAPDVVVMNVCMPKVNGIEATTAIKAMRPEIRILGISAHDEDRYVFPMLNAGATGYLLKTSSGTDLIRGIRIVYGGGTALDPAIAGKVVSRAVGRRSSHCCSPVHELSRRELEVLEAAAEGKSSKQIARNLEISPQTVQAHMRNIFTKLQVGSRAEAVAFAVRDGWISANAGHG